MRARPQYLGKATRKGTLAQIWIYGLLAYKWSIGLWLEPIKCIVCMMWSQEALRARYEEVRETRPNYPPVLYECQVNSEITEFTKFTEFTEITSSTKPRHFQKVWPEPYLFSWNLVPSQFCPRSTSWPHSWTRRTTVTSWPPSQLAGGKVSPR